MRSPTLLLFLRSSPQFVTKIRHMVSSLIDLSLPSFHSPGLPHPPLHQALLSLNIKLGLEMSCYSFVSWLLVTLSELIFLAHLPLTFKYCYTPGLQSWATLLFDICYLSRTLSQVMQIQKPFTNVSKTPYPSQTIPSASDPCMQIPTYVHKEKSNVKDNFISLAFYQHSSAQPLSPQA